MQYFAGKKINPENYIYYENIVKLLLFFLSQGNLFLKIFSPHYINFVKKYLDSRSLSGMTNDFLPLRENYDLKDIIADIFLPLHG